MTNDVYYQTAQRYLLYLQGDPIGLLVLRSMGKDRSTEVHGRRIGKNHGKSPSGPSPQQHRFATVE